MVKNDKDIQLFSRFRKSLIILKTNFFKKKPSFEPTLFNKLLKLFEIIWNQFVSLGLQKQQKMR